MISGSGNVESQCSYQEQSRRVHPVVRLRLGAQILKSAHGHENDASPQELCRRSLSRDVNDPEVAEALPAATRGAHDQPGSYG